MELTIDILCVKTLSIGNIYSIRFPLLSLPDLNDSLIIRNSIWNIKGITFNNYISLNSEANDYIILDCILENSENNYSKLEKGEYVANIN